MTAGKSNNRDPIIPTLIARASSSILSLGRSGPSVLYSIFVWISGCRRRRRRCPLEGTRGTPAWQRGEETTTTESRAATGWLRLRAHVPARWVGEIGGRAHRCMPTQGGGHRIRSHTVHPCTRNWPRILATAGDGSKAGRVVCKTLLHQGRTPIMGAAIARVTRIKHLLLSYRIFGHMHRLLNID